MPAGGVDGSGGRGSQPGETPEGQRTLQGSRRSQDRSRAIRRSRSPAERAAARTERAAAADLQTVLDAAAAFLGIRMRSVGETRRRLQRRGYPADLVETALARLTELGYLDDLAFARAWVESRDRARPRGEAALRRELYARGVPREVIDEALTGRNEPPAGAPAESRPADDAAALRLLERRGAALALETDPARRRRRAYALLARNGFDVDVCRAAVDRWSGRTAVGEDFAGGGEAGSDGAE